MLTLNADKSSSLLRLPVLAGMLAAYAFMAYRIASLPNQWLGVLIVLCAGVIGMVFIRQRHFALLTAMALVIPLVGFDFSLYYNAKLGGDHRIAASLLDFTLLGLLAHYLLTVPHAERRPLRPSALKWLMACLFLLALLSVNLAKEPALTYFEIIRLFRMMALAWIVTKCVNSQPALQRVLLALFAITIAEGALGFAQKLTGGQLALGIVGGSEKVMTQALNTGDTAIRVAGTFGHTNQFARYLGLVLPLALAVVIAAPKKSHRLIASAALVMGGGALVATLSRAAWIGVALGSALVFGAMIMQPLLRARAVQSLKVILLLFVPFVLINIETFIARFTSQDEGSFATREPMARIALKIIQEHPLGIGYGNYRVILPRYGDPAEPFTLQAKVHNMYLLIAAELGIGSLVVFLGILLVVFVQCLALTKRMAPDVGMVTIGIAGGLLAFAIHGMVDYEEIGRIPILWLHIGLVAAITRLHLNTGPGVRELNLNRGNNRHARNGVL
ncbi:O-antigen ligase family protein [candidate division KSB1 bacterium]|nr:O-antigen ligase family protein [candidate division KSB1 bacterium]